MTSGTVSSASLITTFPLVRRTVSVQARHIGAARVSPVVDDQHVRGVGECERVRVLFRVEVGAFLSECAEGGGVGAGFGGEVAAEAEHVRPLAQPQGLEFGDSSELPAGVDQMSGVVGQVPLVQIEGA